MNGQVNDFLPLAAKVAGEFGNIPDGEIGACLGVSKQAAHKLAHAALSSLREKLQQLGFSGGDTLGLLKSASSVPRPSPSTSSLTRTRSPSASACRVWKNRSLSSSTKPSSAIPKTASPTPGN